jgi:hypothetical protein
MPKDYVDNQSITEAEEAKLAGCPGKPDDCTTNAMATPNKEWNKPLFPEGHKDYHDLKLPFTG